MRIGIDIDNVIANTFTELIPYYNRFMKREDSPQEVIERMRREKLKMLFYYFYAWRKKVMTSLTLLDGAAETIRRWHPEHQIKLVTSRLPLFNRQTKDWLAQNQVPFHELHHAAERTKYKKAKGCDLFIEDNLDESEILADHCDRIFLMDQPWNRRAVAKKNIIRVKDWRDLVANL